MSYPDQHSHKPNSMYWAVELEIILLFCAFFHLFTFVLFETSPDVILLTSHKNKVTFIVSNFGKKEITNTGYIKRYLSALSSTAPGSKVVIGVCENTVVDNTLFNYPLNIEPYPCPFALPEEEVYKIYGKISWYYVPITTYYYGKVRYSFYKEYLTSHPSDKFFMISDRDALILRNPYELIVTDPDAVHIMEDIYPLSVTSDFNFKWFNAFYRLNSSIKEKCKYKDITDLTNQLKKIPLNAGTYLGKRENILIIASMMKEKFDCHGLFELGNDQGMLNYLVLSGAFEGTGLRIKNYPCPSAMISCPDLIPLEKFSKFAKNVYLLHHYYNLNQKYLDVLEPRTVHFIKLQ